MPLLEMPAHGVARFLCDAASCAGELLLWGVGRRKRMRVAGSSMRPTMAPGDHLFYRRAGAGLAAIGSVVVLRHTQSPCGFMVKRVRGHLPGGLWVASDGVGMGSERLGLIPMRDVVGLVTARIGEGGYQRMSLNHTGARP